MSYGEFTRVGDRVVFSMPLDSPRGERLQLVNLPASVVNWDSTDQYATATRYAQYVASRAEADYAVLTGQVASALNEIALAKDPARRAAHRRAGAAASRSRGRPSISATGRPTSATCCRCSASTISELRGGTASRRQFAFDLVASIEPPSMPLLPDPTPTQAIEQVLLAARLSDVPAERITLLRSAISAIDEKAAQLPKNWARQTRASAQATLDAELAVERRYAELSRATVAQATAAAAAADVRGVEKAMSTLQARDRVARREAEGPGRRPPGAAPGEAGFGPAPPAASRPVVPQGGGVSRVPGPRAAARSTGSRSSGRDSRTSSRSRAPPSRRLPGLMQSFERICRQLALIKPPDDLVPAHATLQSAAELGAAGHAHARARHRAG